MHVNTSIPEVDAYANTTNFRWAIKNWLANKSDANDVVFIYVVTHGKGMAIPPPPGFEYWAKYQYNGYYDEEEDEMYGGYYEVQEGNLGKDINNDNMSGWVGVDEALRFDDGDVIDDELADDLNSIFGNYSTLIFVTNQCTGGGLINDLSAPNRIIITATDETHLAIADANGDGISEWTELFFDALHGEDTSYNLAGNGVVHEGIAVDADYNNDGHVSILEAFNYTMNFTSIEYGHGEYYPQMHWLDDDGDRLPTFFHERDMGDEIDNGTLASNVWFPSKYYNLSVRTYDTSSDQEFNGVNVWIDCNPVGNSPVVANVSGGHVWHNVTVESVLYDTSYKYTFQYWEDNSTSNLRFVHIDSNTTITAYYTRECIRYMQNAKWDSTYWKLFLNNTSTYASQTRTIPELVSRGYLGVKVYKGTTNISNVIEVGYWSNGESGLKSTTWDCSKQNVTGTHMQIEIWYKFEGYSWTSMDIVFKTETFTQNTILNATTWTIYLYGGFFQLNP